MIPKACTLTSRGRLLQRGRFRRLRGEIDAVERRPTELTVRFTPAVDESLLGKAVAVERDCCSFLDIALERHVLRIASDDPSDIDPFEAMLR